MRVISGKFKGKLIQFIKSEITRPLKDSVKENIFNILTHSKEINIQIENAEVLDLYSGIGSFGIECLSRRAKKVTFIEKDPSAVKILKENLLDLSVENKKQADQIIEVMQTCVELNVPSVVDYEKCASWGEIV